MKKNLYYATVLRRENIFLNAIYDFGLRMASYPRLLIEVFIRKHFGERYFSLATAITLSVILLLMPAVLRQFTVALMGDGEYFYGAERPPSFWAQFALWYAFTIAFMYFSYLRWREIRTEASVFDFGRFSLSSGIMLPFFHDFVEIKKWNIRWVEIFVEPAAFFIAGILLILIGQKIGWVLTLSAFFYALSYAGAYKNGDNFVLDKIDQMIMNEELQSAFVDDNGAEKTRGVRFYMNKPTEKEMREKLAAEMVEEDDFATVL